MFMGAKVGNPSDGKEVLINVPAWYSKKDWTDTHLTSDLEYNKRWDWLMPVVEKIESLGYEFRFYTDEVEILDIKTSNYVLDCLSGNSKIDATLKGCIYFINWYNQQTK